MVRKGLIEFWTIPRDLYLLWSVKTPRCYIDVLSGETFDSPRNYCESKGKNYTKN